MPIVSCILANLVVGLDGATTIQGRSQLLSSETDRERFHQLRKRADLILIGGETSRTEPYGKTPVPLVVLSRNPYLTGSAANNPQAILMNSDITTAIASLSGTYQTILIEGGARLLAQAIEGDLVDDFYVTATNVEGEGPFFDTALLASSLALISTEESSSDLRTERFLHYARLPKM